MLKLVTSIEILNLNRFHEFVQPLNYILSCQNINTRVNGCVNAYMVTVFKQFTNYCSYYFHVSFCRQESSVQKYQSA